MRFGRHLKEVIVPGKEADCVRYDELKVAIKTQIAARWEYGESVSESEASTSGRLEEGLLDSSEEARERKRRAFYDALGFELRRVSRQYDGSLAQLKRKVASLLGEAQRGSVLDLLQLGADEEALEGPASSPEATSPDGSNILPSPHAGQQHQQQLDRAFRHVYHEVTLVRHHTNLNYTGLRKIVKKFLKKTCQAIAASDAENGDDALRDELTALLDIIPITNRPLHALSALATDEDAGPHGVGSGDEPDSVDGSDAARPLARPSSHAAPSSVGAHHRRARSHIPLPASPNRNVYKATAAAAESEIRARLRALPFTRGAELASLAEDLERAYTKALCLTHENHGEDVVRVARRRLRLIERPAPPAAGRLSAYSAGVSTCAAAAIAVMWSRPATHSDRCPRCLEYFAACVPAFRLTAIPIAWLWCWAGVTRACGAHYINYRFIMEVSLSEEAGWHWNAAMAAVLTAAWLVIFALFSACVRFGADPLSWNVVPAYYPLGLIVFFVMAFVFPPASIFAVTSEGGAPRRRAWDNDKGDFARLRAQLARVGRALTRVFNPYARASLVRSIAHMAMAPFGPPVRFRDNLVADVACSLVRSLVDFETTARFFLTGEYEKDRPSLRADYGPTSPVITAVPYWFRLQQCVRRFYDAKRGSRERVEHMINAGKYFVSLLSISLASLGGYSSVTNLNPRTDPGQVAWIAALVVGTLYSYAWDIIMDWGLIAVDFDGGKRTLPRVQWATTRDRVFRSRKFYAWAMFSNLVGRCAWAVTITPHGKGGLFFLLSGGLTGEALGTVVAVIELLRRAQWTFLRLENEYLNNAARYRSVVAAPMLLDEVGSSNWDSEWKFEREEASANTKTITVYLVVAANALAALAVMGVFYLVYSR